MVCDCCLRRKRLFESFAAVTTEDGTMNLCVVCNDLAYKIRDDANDNNREMYEAHLNELDKRGKKANPIFLEWKKQYVCGLEAIFQGKSASTIDDEKEAETDDKTKHT